ncbi:MAG TPA: hypothetical protein VEB67_02355, partial [Nitrososphaerales archaeon]|nr:hypothetical protein [Nitrososphaerales archaeon]
MPEIWIPFGSVETLVTIQAENLGAVEAPDPEKSTGETERMAEETRGATKLFLTDSSPTTIEVLRELTPAMAASPALKIFAAAPKKVEAGVSDLKGRVSTLPPPVRVGDLQGPIVAQELLEPGPKVFLGTSRPDPMFGLVDAKVQACLNWVAGSLEAAAATMRSMEPVPFQRTEAYDSVESTMEPVGDSTFLSVIPRGGKPRTVMENDPFDAIKNDFY